MSALSLFHPLLQDWFSQNVGTPTHIQELAWPCIAANEHALVIAPTGSGKTLTAFFWALNKLLSGDWRTGSASVLYISPLKALNNDIRRNLSAPLQELKEFFERAGAPFPQIRALTRSGDTSQTDRRRMLSHPPEILITTPESLNLLLSSQGGRTMLTSLKTVILDEIHAVAGSKRGVHLISAVERLVPLSGEFQRIALSATVRPAEAVAEFVGGHQLTGPKEAPQYTPRPVRVLRSESEKKYAIHIHVPEGAEDTPEQVSIWDPLVKEFRELIEKNRSTLLFVNSRRLCEKLALKINAGAPAPVAYAHHGSLSRELRETVEGKLKAGELKAIVATSSLELGIDVGALDQVALLQTPPSISAALQRLGRAGHQVGETSRGAFYPTHGHDLLESAVLAKGVLERSIEPVKRPHCPLDVLAQMLVSMTGVEEWDLDALYNQVRCVYSWRDLGRREFDLVLDMLAGRYADSRIRELKPRVSIDRAANTVRAKKGALLALYMSGGVIPDRGYFTLRHAKSNARIGELDEEFVWEARIGQTFALGSQKWRIERITHNDVFVTPGSPTALDTPFWLAEEQGRDAHFSLEIASFLEEAEARWGDPEFANELPKKHSLAPGAAKKLLEYLKEQRESTGCALPHRNHLLVEHIRSGPGGAQDKQLALHTMWGLRVNQPFALALDAAWGRRYGGRLEIFAGNDCIYIMTPGEVTGEELLSLVNSSNVEPLLQEKMEGSGFFGARFRECAGRALLLGRSSMTRRMPLWMNRLRSKKLLAAVKHYGDFPILLEAWRTCLQDEFEMPVLQMLLAELEAGALRWSETETGAASPFAQSLAWRQINKYMYMRDEPESGAASGVQGGLLRDVVFTPGLRPQLEREIIRRFEAKRQRLYPGYAPADERDLVDWVRERVCIPMQQWAELLDACKRDHDFDPSEHEEYLEKRLLRAAPEGANSPVVLTAEDAPRVQAAWWPDDPPFVTVLRGAPVNIEGAGQGEEGDALEENEQRNALLGQWLQFFGPVRVCDVRNDLGLSQENLQNAMQDLLETETLVLGELILDDEAEYICDAGNLETLLRMARADRAPHLEPLPKEKLPLFLAQAQGLTSSSSDNDALFQRLEQLSCLPGNARLWETEFLPARCDRYAPERLDGLLQEGEVMWLGAGEKSIAFCLLEERELLHAEGVLDDGNAQDVAAGVESLMPDQTARYDFLSLLNRSGQGTQALAERLWAAVWQGHVTNDSAQALRTGVKNDFKVPDLAIRRSGGHRTRRSSRPVSRTSGAQRIAATPYAGAWYRLSPPAWVAGEDDLLAREERNKDRVRVVLERYGVVFRELLQREAPPFRWAPLFRSLRLMELSGEVLSGMFFEGIPGPQFISHQGLRSLQRGLPDGGENSHPAPVWWINAKDPASLCGIGLESFKGELPRRVDGTHLCYHGERLVLVSERKGKRLFFHAAPDDEELPRYVAPLRHLLTRPLAPLRRISVEEINNENARVSPYLDVLKTAFDVVMDKDAVLLFSSY